MSGLLEGLALLAAELGHGVYRVGEPYVAGEVALVLGDAPPIPDRLVAIRAYPSGPEPDARLPFTEAYVQLRVRGSADESDSRDRAQALYSDLHGRGRARVRLASGDDLVVMSIIATTSGPIPLGRDEAGRHEHTVNVRVDHVDPTSQRPAL